MGIKIKSPHNQPAKESLKVVYQMPSPRMSSREFGALKQRFERGGGRLIGVFIRATIVEVHYNPPGERYVLIEELKRDIDKHAPLKTIWTGLNRTFAKGIKKK